MYLSSDYKRKHVKNTIGHVKSLNTARHTSSIGSSRSSLGFTQFSSVARQFPVGRNDCLGWRDQLAWLVGTIDLTGRNGCLDRQDRSAEAIANWMEQRKLSGRKLLFLAGADPVRLDQICSGWEGTLAMDFLFRCGLYGRVGGGGKRRWKLNSVALKRADGTTLLRTTGWLCSGKIQTPTSTNQFLYFSSYLPLLLCCCSERVRGRNKTDDDVCCARTYIGRHHDTSSWQVFFFDETFARGWSS